MAITFYPQDDDVETGSIAERLAILLESAERYRGIILDQANKPPEGTPDPNKRSVPRELVTVYNWDGLAKVLRELRHLPENNRVHRLAKADYLVKLAEVYEALRAAKMPKLEAVRLALLNEAGQLKDSTAA